MLSWYILYLTFWWDKTRACKYIIISKVEERWKIDSSRVVIEWWFQHKMCVNIEDLFIRVTLAAISYQYPDCLIHWCVTPLWC